MDSLKFQTFLTGNGMLYAPEAISFGGFFSFLEAYVYQMAYDHFKTLTDNVFFYGIFF